MTDRADLVKRLRELSVNMRAANLDMQLPEGSIDPDEAADALETAWAEGMEEAAKVAEDDWNGDHRCRPIGQGIAAAIRSKIAERRT